MNTTQQKTLIFDFDGTIADTFPHVFAIGNTLAEQYGFNTIDASEIEKYKSYTIKEIFREFNVPIWKLPLIARKVKKELNTVIKDVNPFPNIVDVLKKLHSAGYTLILLTSNDKANVEAFLKSNNIEVFDHIHTGSSVFGKARHIRKILRNLNVDNAIYIGDEVRDIEAARKAGVKSIAVTWGYNSEEILKKFQPDAMVTKPEELLPFIHKL